MNVASELVRIAQSIEKNAAIKKLRKRRKKRAPGMKRQKGRAYYRRHKPQVKRQRKLYVKKHRPEIKRLRKTRWKRRK